MGNESAEREVAVGGSDAEELGDESVWVGVKVELRVEITNTRIFQPLATTQGGKKSRVSGEVARHVRKVGGGVHKE